MPQASKYIKMTTSHHHPVVSPQYHPYYLTSLALFRQHALALALEHLWHFSGNMLWPLWHFSGILLWPLLVSPLTLRQF
jgi:hypothetical protein